MNADEVDGRRGRIGFCIASSGCFPRSEIDAAFLLLHILNWSPHRTHFMPEKTQTQTVKNNSPLVYHLDGMPKHSALFNHKNFEATFLSPAAKKVKDYETEVSSNSI